MRQGGVGEHGRRAGSDLVHYLGLDDEMIVPMVLVGYINVYEDDCDKLREYLSIQFNLNLNNYPAE